MEAEAIRQAERQRIDALVNRDLPALDRLCDDRLVYTHSVGRRDDKTAFLAAVESGAVIYQAVEHEFDDVLAENGLAWTSGDMRASISAGGRQIAVDALTTSVWVHRGDGWKLLALQTTARA